MRTKALHTANVESIRNSTESDRIWAERLGVSRLTVYSARRGKGAYASIQCTTPPVARNARSRAAGLTSPVLTVEEVDKVRRNLEALTDVQWAAEFGVSRSTVYNARTASNRYCTVGTVIPRF